MGSTIALYYGNGLGGFAYGNSTSVPTGTALYVSLFDINNDGSKDLIVPLSQNGINFYLNNGTGTFSFASSNTYSGFSGRVSSADFNNDNNVDFAMGNGNSQAPVIFLGNGNGTFTTTTLPLTQTVSFLTTGEFTGDNFPDIAITQTNNTLVLFKGNGNGTFTNLQTFTVGSAPKGIAMADFNGDYRYDIVAANSGSSNVSILIAGINEMNVQGNGINIPDSNQVISTSDNTDMGSAIPCNHTVRPFTIQNTGNGKLTIHSVNFSGPYSSAFSITNVVFPVVINVNGTFTLPVKFSPTGTGIHHATIHLVNNDCDENDYTFNLQGQGIAGTPALGTYSTASVVNGNNISVTPAVAPVSTSTLFATASSGFTGFISIDQNTGVVRITNAKPSGTFTITITAGTCLTRTFTLNVLNGQCSIGGFSTPAFFPVDYTYDVAVGDFNNDGKSDFVRASNSGSTSIVGVHIGNGSGGFTSNPNVILSTGIQPRSIVVADFNNDGNADIATGNFSGNSVAILHGNGNGSFSLFSYFPVAASPISIVTGDFNNDHVTDFATLHQSSNSVSIGLSNGLGSYSITTGIATGSSPQSFVVADLDSDGNDDIAVANASAVTATILFGNGLGAFTTDTINFGFGATTIAAGDFNNDGRTDLACPNVVTSIRLGNGTRNLTTGVNVNSNSGNSIVDLYVEDVTGDGNIDLITGGFSTYMHFGNGSGGFGGPVHSPINFGEIEIADFNSDGLKDAIQNKSGTVYFSYGVNNQIVLKANNITIPDGSIQITPSINTDFGSSNLCNNIVKTFTIVNSGNQLLTISGITFTGLHANAFQVIGRIPPSINAGDSAFFKVTFRPFNAGINNAVMHITNNNCQMPDYDIAVSGTGGNTPTIGSYPPTIMMANGNITVTPLAIPSNTSILSATTSGNFRGVITADPLTGKVYINNAWPAGNYLITVSSGTCSSQSFNLTVTNGNCSNGELINSSNFPQTVSNSIGMLNYNNDLHTDLVSYGMVFNQINFMQGNGTGSFTTYPDTVSENFTIPIYADFNLDGNLDFAGGPPHNIKMFLSDGNGDFVLTYKDSIIGLNLLTNGDFNNDRIPDLAVELGSHLVIATGNGTGQFSYTGAAINVNNIKKIYTLDFNHDGNLDIAYISHNTYVVHLLSGNGNGTFTTLPSISIGEMEDILFADFNNDSKLDFAAALENSTTVHIRMGNGLGGFSGTTTVTIGSGPTHILGGDFNADGKSDFVTMGTSTLSLRFGNGLGGFTGTTNINIPNLWGRICVADYNNDGRLDIATTRYSPNTLSMYFGSANEISVAGINNDTTVITNGDLTPTVLDNTDFGNIPEQTPASRIFQIKNSGTQPLSVTGITFTGSNASDFTTSAISFPTTIQAGSSVSFNINFFSQSIGSKNTVAHIQSNHCSISDYTYALSANAIYNCPGNISDGDSCTMDACDPITGITHTPISPNDGNPCTIDDCHPIIGPFYTPVNPDDGIAFTEDGCDTVTGIFNRPVFHLKMYLEGYYSGNGFMNHEGLGGTLYRLGYSPNATDVDTVELSFYNNPPVNPVAIAKSILQTNGDATFQFNNTLTGSYYLKVKHRSTIETWSSSPISLTTNNSYDFTDFASKAYGNNLIQTFDLSHWAMYEGDITNANLVPGMHDGIVDNYDFIFCENALNIILLGYNPQDISGDGVVESIDYTITYNNYHWMIFSITP